MNKKAIAILGAIFLLIVGTLGFLIYSRYATKSESSENPPVNENPVPGEYENPTGEDPVVENPTTTPEHTQRFVRLTQDQVLSPALFYDGTGLTYFDRQGKVYLQDFQDQNGTVALVNLRNLDYPVKAYIEKILWPRTGKNYIAQLNSAGKRSWSFFDVDKKEYMDLPSQVYWLDWMPDGQKILFVWLDKGKATLNMANPDTTGYQEISELWEQDNAISVSPDGLNILFYRTESQEASNAIKLTTPDGKVWRDLVKDGYNYGVLWAPDSQKFLFGKKERNTQKFQLWYYDLMTGEVKNLGLPTTVDKAVWDKEGKYVFSAVPTAGTAGDGNLTIDKFYRINTQDLSDKKEYDPGQLQVDGRDLFLSGDGARLFFKNAQDGSLYYLDLTK